jgi:nucleoside-diphosphate-sugar epimerase
MKVLVTGATGYLGSILVDFLRRGVDQPPEVLGLGSNDLDVRDSLAVQRIVCDFSPHYVFHLAAKADTEWCEDHFEEAVETNVVGSLNVVRAGLDVGARVVYFSSACIYPTNTRRHTEAGPIDGLCKYTATKVMAEQALSPHAWDILIVRMRQPFSNHLSQRNLLQKLASYSSFIDEQNSMSHVEESLPVVWRLALRPNVTGPVNIVNEGAVTPLWIARKIKEMIDPGKLIYQMSYGTLLQKVRAVRVNSLVDTTRLNCLGFRLKPVVRAIDDCLREPCSLGEFPWNKARPRK